MKRCRAPEENETGPAFAQNSAGSGHAAAPGARAKTMLYNILPKPFVFNPESRRAKKKRRFGRRCRESDHHPMRPGFKMTGKNLFSALAVLISNRFESILF